jgi:carbon-monoxide dehydrogenase small subunit
MSEHKIEVEINGSRHRATLESRLTLADYLRGDAGYTGVHVGCEHGVCGACTVIVDGRAVRSCLMLAVQTDGSTIRTIEGLAAPDGSFNPVQQALRDCHGLQCGFCTPGVAMTLTALTEGGASPDAETLTKAMSGHICRCTGYQGIRRAIRQLTSEPAGEEA